MTEAKRESKITKRRYCKEAMSLSQARGASSSEGEQEGRCQEVEYGTNSNGMEIVRGENMWRNENTGRDGAKRA